MNKLKIIFLLALFFQLSYLAKTQNLVLNSSFEDNKQIPFGRGFPIDSFAFNWSNPINHLGSTDYFHINAIIDQGWNFTIPNNLSGTQDTCDKMAYAGIIVYATDPNFPNTYNYREYLTGVLDTMLLANQCYKVSFKYSLGEAPSHYAISNFGIYFSDSIPIYTPSVNDWNNLNNQPQIVINQWMNDEINWIKIERFYLAQGGEKNITLGNFSDNFNTNITFVKNGFNSFGGKGSYIYIDDVRVEEVPLLSLPQINLGSDTILCEGEQITFDSLLPNNPIYVWNNLVESSDSTYTIDSTGTYWIEAYNGCSYTTDTIRVEFVEPKVILGNDTTLCKREELLLQNNNESTNHPKTEFLWNTGDTTSLLNPLDSGEYWLNAKIGHCVDRDSIYIQHYIPLNSKLLSADQDTIFCVNGTLDAGSSEWNDTYIWNTDETTQTIEVTETGNYTVDIENECTEAISTYNVKVESLEEGLNNYNIFSPNNDFVNELFTIYEGNSEEYQIQIYNRWGKLVWETDEPTNHWSAKGISDGSYFYYLSFRNCAGEMVEQKGSLSVLR